MKILQCDCCHAQVNDFGCWSNKAKPRNMYEVKLVHECERIDNCGGMIFCSRCLEKLWLNADKSDEVEDGNNTGND